jgi:hypothetical protein
MIIREPELLELLRDEPELLAVADAISETQRLRRPNRLRWAAPRALAVAGVAAAIAIGLLAMPTGNHSVTEKALAAIGDGRVLHIVTREGVADVLVDLKTGRRRVQWFTAEQWSDRGSQRVHLVYRVGGQVADLLLPEDATRPGVTLGSGGPDPAVEALWSGYRKALASGEAKLDGEGTIDGHAVYWLRFPAFQQGLPGTEVAIDRDTYKPIVFRYSRGKMHHDSRVLVAETIGYRASDFTRVGLNLLSGILEPGTMSSSSGSAASVELTSPWLTAGQQVDGLALRGVRSLDETVEPDQGPNRSFHGVELIYGTSASSVSDEADSNTLTVQEFVEPPDPAEWSSIPNGSIRITKSGQGRESSWSGDLVSSGVYVTVETGRSEATLVEAARALRPAP